MSETELYRPSNGTEGDCFMSAFCERCANDSEDDPCEIIGRTMALDVDELGYPTEWIRDVGPWPGNPRCTAFVPEGSGIEYPTIIADDRQIGLPL